MRRIGWLAGTAITIAVAANPSQGVVTATAPVRSSDSSVLGCAVLNLSDVGVEVTAELNSGLSSVVESGSLLIPAGEGRTIVSSSVAIFGGYCVFDFDGNPSEVRGYIRLIDLGGSNTRQLFPAEPFVLQRRTMVRTYTPPMRSSDGDNLLCIIQNLSPDAVEVTAELDNGQGTIVDDGTLVIEPGFAGVLASSNTAIFGGFCRFGFSANTSELRGYISLQDAGGSNTRLLYPALPVIQRPAPTFTPTPIEVPTCPAIPATPTPAAVETCPPAPTMAPCGEGECCGDCNGDGTVRINELITAVNFALGGCPAP